jgi:hypothetical protein
MMLDAIPEDIATPHVIVGNFNASAYGQELLARYRDRRHVRLLSAIYDPTKLAALRSGCHAYLHGHSVGGTNPSLVEILPYGVPVLCFDCSFNRYTMGGHGGYFTSAADLRQTLISGNLGQYCPPAEMSNDPAINGRQLPKIMRDWRLRHEYWHMMQYRREYIPS